MCSRHCRDGEIDDRTTGSLPAKQPSITTASPRKLIQMEKATMQRTPIALAALAFCALSLSPAHADEAALKAEVDALRTEVAALKDAVHQMQAERVAATA